MNHTLEKTLSFIVCVSLGGGTLAQVGCGASTPEAADGDEDRAVSFEEITLADIESLAAGEAITIDLDIGVLYMISGDAVTAGADQIILMTPEGEVTLREWQDQAHALGVQFEAGQAITIAGDPEWFGTLNDEQIARLEREPVVVADGDANIEFEAYWCFLKCYGCVVVIIETDVDE